MKHVFSILAILTISFSFSCKNAYNELIPNNEQNILSFTLASEDSQTRSVSTEIKEKYITVKVPKGTDVTRLFVQAKISKQATLFPLTLRYLQEAFPMTDVVDLALRMSINPAAKSLDKWFLDLYLENPKFNIPPLVFPINFFSPVQFAVIGGQGDVEIYTVKVLYEDGGDPSNPPPPPPPAPDEPIPQESEKRIITFKVALKQKGESIITDNEVKFFCQPGTDVRVLLPDVTCSSDCIALPLTKEYLFALANKLGLDALTVAQGYLTATNKEAFLRATLAPCNTSHLTQEIDKTIDFTEAVQFLVINIKDKTVKLYTVTCLTNGELPYLENIAISKFQNPQVMKDAIGAIDEVRKTIECTVYYPVEYVATHPESLKVHIDVGYSGNSVQFEYNGNTYAEYDAIPFVPVKISQKEYHLGVAVMTVHVLQDDKKNTYKCKISFEEDADTIRSITDFRFEKFCNSDIKATAVASIVNRDDEGEIKATVLYTSDTEPHTLIPSFITGGRASVFVNNISQISKQSQQNFPSDPATIQYVCVSKDTHYKRTYTVKVKFIKVERPEALMKKFSFGIHLNEGIAGEAVATINNTAKTINVEILHTTPIVPEELIPEFESTGVVSVGGILQTSGFSKHSFRYDVYYKVTSIDDSSVTTIYKVHVTFKHSEESKCQLLRFYFTQTDNPGLREDVECYISAASYNVFGLLPNGTDITSLIPRFEKYGKVRVTGAEQTSGVNSQDFSNIVDYVLESDNGQYSKTYKVKMQVAGDIIYLSTKAHGKNNGTSWQDAFTTLEEAIDAANKMTSPPEIWVQADGFVGKRIEINKAIILRGGFAGVETSKNERANNAGKLRKRLSLNNTVIIGMGNAEISGQMVLDGIETDGNIDFFDSLRFASNNSSMIPVRNSILFDDCLMGSRVPVNVTNLDSLTILNSTFKANADLSFFYENSNFVLKVEASELSNRCIMGTGDLGKIEVKDTIIASTFALSAKNIEMENLSKHDSAKITLSLAWQGLLKCNTSRLNPITIKANDKASIYFKNADIEEIVFEERNLYVTTQMKDVNFDNCTVQNVTTADKLVAEKLTIFNCRNSTAKFRLSSIRTEIRSSEFAELDVHVNNPGSSQSIDTQVDHLTANKFYCGAFSYNTQIILNVQYAQYKHNYREAIDARVAGGVQMITNSHFKNTLWCMGGEKIELKQVKLDATINTEETQFIKYPMSFPNYSFIVLRNSNTANSEILLEEVDGSVPKDNEKCASWLRCITENLTVGRQDGTSNNTGVKGFARAEFYGKNSCDVRSCNFETIRGCWSDDHNDTINGYYKEIPGLLLGGNRVTFTKNVLCKLHANSDYYKWSPVRCKISCNEELNYAGNIPEMLDLILYHPKPHTFANERFVAVELLQEKPFEFPFPLPVNEGEIHMNDCFFTTSFVNQRPNVFMEAPKFNGTSISTSSHILDSRHLPHAEYIVACANTLTINNMIAKYNFIEGSGGGIFICDGARLKITNSEFLSPGNAGESMIKIEFQNKIVNKLDSLGNYEKIYHLVMKNCKVEKETNLMNTNNSNILIDNCDFSYISNFIKGNSRVEMKNSTIDIPYWVLEEGKGWYAHMYELDMDNCDVKVSSTNDTTREQLFYAEIAKINNSRWKDTRTIADKALETGKMCTITDSTFENVGKLRFHTQNTYSDALSEIVKKWDEKTREHKEITIKNTLFTHADIDLYLATDTAERDNNYKSNVSALFENVDFFDGESSIDCRSYFHHYHLNESPSYTYDHEGPTPIKFRYKETDLKQSIRDKIQAKIADGTIPPGTVPQDAVKNIIVGKFWADTRIAAFFSQDTFDLRDNSTEKIYGTYQ